MASFGLFQILGWGLFVATAVVLYPRRVLRAAGAFEAPQTVMLALIGAALVLQFHGDEQDVLAGIGYTLVLLATIAALAVVWTLDIAALSLLAAGAAGVIVLFGLSAIAVLGLPEGRALGGIHPNTVGASMLSGFVLAQFRTGPVMVAIRVMCLVLAVLVSSRFAVLGCTIAFVVRELLYRPLGPKLIAGFAAVVAAAVLFGPQITAILAVDDPMRNFDSGISGREDLWLNALKSIVDYPLGIGFKRASPLEGGHNGYLKIVVEFGVTGGILMIVALVAACAAAVARAFGATPLDRRLILAARAGGLCAYAFGTFFEPQMFNFGDTHGVMVLLLLFAPVRDIAGPVFRTATPSVGAPAPASSR
ncbi:O-antigen ligase family protein [Rhodoplanes azumiensis]|uniref:O-antigen ligase family protein n=1 Tax=Rhodoplanes azumiensis TaxID=1897628 RepID=A0ABW5ANJ1_9BRAD